MLLTACNTGIFSPEIAAGTEYCDCACEALTGTEGEYQQCFSQCQSSYNQGLTEAEIAGCSAQYSDVTQCFIAFFCADSVDLCEREQEDLRSCLGVTEG